MWSASFHSASTMGMDLEIPCNLPALRGLGTLLALQGLGWIIGWCISQIEVKCLTQSGKKKEETERKGNKKRKGKKKKKQKNEPKPQKVGEGREQYTG